MSKCFRFLFFNCVLSVLVLTRCFIDLNVCFLSLVPFSLVAKKNFQKWGNESEIQDVISWRPFYRPFLTYIRQKDGRRNSDERLTFSADSGRWFKQSNRYRKKAEMNVLRELLRSSWWRLSLLRNILQNFLFRLLLFLFFLAELPFLLQHFYFQGTNLKWKAVGHSFNPSTVERRMETVIDERLKNRNNNNCDIFWRKEKSTQLTKVQSDFHSTLCSYPSVSLINPHFCFTTSNLLQSFFFISSPGSNIELMWSATADHGDQVTRIQETRRRRVVQIKWAQEPLLPSVWSSVSSDTTHLFRRPSFPWP